MGLCRSNGSSSPKFLSSSGISTIGAKAHFNSFLNNKIYVEGIKEIDKTDIDITNKLGYKIKLLGFAELLGKKIYQRVHPTLIKKESHVASIDGVLNAVIVDGNPIGQSIIQGEGAGPAATTSALISDISSILRCGLPVDPYSLWVLCNEVKRLYFETAPWAYMSPTLHKGSIHI